MQARRLLSTLFAVAIISTSCSALSNPTAAGPPPPPVDDRINTEAAFPDDGLTRLIVTPIAGAVPAASTDGSGGIVPSPGAAPMPVDPSRLLTPGMVAAMPPGAALEARDGEVGYIDADGNFVAFDPAMLEPTPAPDPEVDDEPVPEIVPLYGNPYVDELAADPAVENIIVIGDGTYGVETSDPSVIDPQVFASVEDVPFGIAEDQYERYQWHLENDGTNLRRVTGETQVEDADLDITPTIGRADGSGIVVAVIDSGVDFSHQDLQDSSWSNLGEICGNGIDDEGNGYVDDCKGWDFAFNDPEPFNRGADVHGTHVAGIITANRNGIGVAGVAPDVRIMDLNVAHSGKWMTGAAITAAVYYAVDNGADIINMSLATRVGASGSQVQGMLNAIEYARSKGVLVVVAAGNNGIDLGSLSVYPASFSLDNMIVVGASTSSDQRATFSNYNDSIVDVYAPGENILSTTPGNGYMFYSGTSQASPNAAGVAALVMQANPEADLSTIIEQVVSTVDPVDALSTSVGRGRTNAASALGLGDAPPIPTEFDVSVSGLANASNEVNAEVAIVTPVDGFAEDYRWELSLITSTDSGAYAVVEHGFMIDGTETATGLTGAVVLGSSALETVGVSTELPDGQYSFVIEAVPTADGNSRLGDLFVTSFQVGDGTVEIDDTATTPTAPVVSTTPIPDAPADNAPDEGVPGGDVTEPPDDVSANEGVDGSTTTTTTPAAAEGNSTTTAPGSSGADETTAPTQGGSSPPTSPPAESGTPVTTAPITTAPATTVPPAVPESGSPATTTEGTDSGSSDGGNTPTPTPPSTMPTAPAPVPPSVGDDSASDGEWAIASISPQAGYVDNANSVTLRGSFPASTYVWFGEQPGQVVHQTDDLITVRTPLRSAAGVVDLSLRATGAGTMLTVPDAYAFVAWGSEQPVATTPNPSDSSDGGTTDGNNGSPDGGTNDGGTNDGDADSGDTNNDDVDEGEAEEEDNGDRRSRMTVGSAVDLPGGLKGAAISPNPAANTPTCSTDPCAATRRS